ncbi:MAG: hypothetical protein CME01_02220 [Geminicoccus sp.]|nr:hypothetical protein [Geminicoccus sp.]
MTDFRSTTAVSQPDLRSTSADVALQSTPVGTGFKSSIPRERRFNVADLFKFSRGRGDLLFSALFLAAALFVALSFFGESGWADRDLPQRRLGKMLKQPWVGPVIAVMILLPAALGNFALSLRRARLDRRKHRPNKTRYEVVQWLRAVEFVAYFIVYTRSIELIGYLFATIIFAVLMVFRLGYRSWRWLGITIAVSFVSVLFFRTMLQIKTPVNIWLYNQLPDGLERFMKVYF